MADEVKKEPKNWAKSNWKHAADKINNQNLVVLAIKDERDRQKRSRKVKKACGRIFKFIVSTAGQLLVNCAYMAVGAFIFTQLEQTNEKMNCENAALDYYKAENATLTLIMDKAQRMDGVGAFTEKDRLEAIKEFKGFAQSFALSVLSNGHDFNKNCSRLGDSENPSDWTELNTLVFAFTIVTTIGYGHISPQTMWGRWVCIAYALIGIPLYIICLATVGEVMANIFRLVYSTVCCCGCCKKKSDKDVTKEEEEKEQQMVEKRVGEWRLDPVTGRPIPPEEGVQFDEEELEEEEEEDEEELTVPLTISLIWLFSFVFIGTAIFAYYEEWTIEDATYFSFITISTIGFGDLVPDIITLDDNLTIVVKAIVIIVYITFGMASISMCFQLMADEVVAKIKWVGEKLGLAKKENEEVEQESSEEEAEITSIKGKESEV